MQPKEEVTVIIPAYKAGKYLEETINSVLKQTVKPDQIIVVDDGSPDNSAGITEKFIPEINLIKQEHGGAAKARNTGIKFSNGSLIAFLDADDIWKKHTLQSLLDTLEKRPELDIVFGKTEQFISPELNESPGMVQPADTKKMQGYLVGSCIIRKQVFNKIGLLDESLQAGEFIDWFNRAKDYGIKFDSISETVLKRRIHKTNLGKLNTDQSKEYLKVLRASLKRRNSGEG